MPCASVSATSASPTSVPIKWRSSPPRRPRFFIDNGAFSAWKKGVLLSADYWAAFYAWLPQWLASPTTWFVIPDEIDSGSQAQDALIRECPVELLPRGWPVWHMDEPISRLLALIERFGRVCIGSTAEYRVVGSVAWRLRMDEAFNAILASLGRVPPVHMLRGLQCLLPTFDYPFSSVDSTNIARNHNRMKKHGDLATWAIVQQTNRWDALNCPTTWPPPRLSQLSLIA